MKSRELFNKAKQYIPGGVNSPVRAFLSVEETPRYIDYAKGSRIFDVDGNEYIDYVCSWGPMILGHNHEAVLEAVTKACEKGLSFGACTEAEIHMASLICDMVPSIERVRMVNSGTEAVMSAIRLARGYTGRNKIIKFEGCYHGHSDAMLVSAGSGLMTAGLQDSCGVPVGAASDTLVAEFNDIENVKKLFADNKDEIAAIILELIPANMGLVLPEEGFLAGIRKLCDENKALLIADEVITGFRLGTGGAQEYFNVKPDLSTFGKIIGAGMPVGAFGGKKEIMEMLAPLGAVYQAGTLSGNPIAMAAGVAQLRILQGNTDIYKNIENLTQQLGAGLKENAQEKNIDAVVKSIGSLSCMYFSKDDVTNYREAKKSDTSMYRQYFKHMLANGIYLAPSQFEVAFMSNAHTSKDIELTLEAFRKFQV